VRHRGPALTFAVRREPVRCPVSWWAEPASREAFHARAHAEQARMSAQSRGPAYGTLGDALEQSARNNRAWQRGAR